MLFCAVLDTEDVLLLLFLFTRRNSELAGTKGFRAHSCCLAIRASARTASAYISFIFGNSLLPLCLCSSDAVLNNRKPPYIVNKLMQNSIVWIFYTLKFGEKQEYFELKKDNSKEPCSRNTRFLLPFWIEILFPHRCDTCLIHDSKLNQA